MKKRNLLVLSMLAMSAMLTACGGAVTPSGDTTSAGGGGGGGGGDGKILVSFYIDYNAANANKEFDLGGGNKLETWATQEVSNNSKVTKPADPTETPLPEFPVFLGWSYKEVINSKDDLWNFDTDLVKSDTNTFSLYGVWVAQGEN